MTDLLPCAHCGKANLVHEPEERTGFVDYNAHAVCLSCGISVYAATLDKVTSRWNTRAHAIPEAQRELWIARLREAALWGVTRHAEWNESFKELADYLEKVPTLK